MYENFGFKVQKTTFFRHFSKSFVIFYIKVKKLENRNISPIFKHNLVLIFFKIIYNMNNEISLMKMESDISALLTMLQEVKEQSVKKVYNTQELCKYLKVGKAVIDKLRQDGELEFSKLGRTIFYTQQDVDKLLKNNHFSFVAA